mmetsp:Transcript_8873/g.29360  ORF Transcript_8873/g.29360 Transcript_8873/m.29360 type:complete len:105 (-) Transcript_8873:65-379(-)
MPGGQVVVFSGLMHLLRSDKELAAVIGHEIAHVVARHSAEKVSRGVTTTLLAAVVGAATGLGVRFMSGAAALGLELPNSRQMELEADAIGLQIMAQGATTSPRP